MSGFSLLVSVYYAIVVSICVRVGIVFDYWSHSSVWFRTARLEQKMLHIFINVCPKWVTTFPKGTVTYF